MLPILAEPSYSNSVWCASLLEGLTGEMKLKRIPFCVVSGLEQADRSSDYIFLIGSDNLWVRAALRACNDAGIYPILLCNQAFHTFDADYSTVCSDMGGSMRYLIETLHSMDCTRIALYGVNRKSVSDECRLDGFLAAQGGAGESDVIFNAGSLERCFLDFIGRANEFDAVICTNDFAAISLTRRLRLRRPELLERLIIMGCAETQLSGFYARYIRSVRVNFEDYGKAAVCILDSLKKNPHLSNVTMAIKWDISSLRPQERRPGKPGRTEAFSALPQEPDVFYKDREVRDMMLVERLLCEGGETDRRIIAMLLQEKPYEEIAASCFLTDSSIKYRVKKMITVCGAKEKKELIALLKTYIDVC